MKKASVIPASGIGDALLMLIASYHLQEEGYDVTTFHPCLSQLQPWLTCQKFAPFPDATDNLEQLFTKDELIIIENDNSPRAKAFARLRREKQYHNISFFYPTYSREKHGPLFPNDQVFNSNLPMAENIAKAISRLLTSPGVSKNNGLTPPQGLEHRKYKNRVVIHPSSSTKEKNWSLKKYLALSQALQKDGFEVVFAVSPSEHALYEDKIRGNGALSSFDTLSDTASFLYESGYLIGNDSLLGHLASNLQIPSLIIASEEKRMRLWRPGWLKGDIVTPPALFSNRKFLRRYWRAYISPRAVLRRFYKLCRTP